MKQRSKTLISTILILALLAAFLPQMVASALTPGDVNGDGKIHSSDARIVLRAAARMQILTPEQTAAADVDGSGRVTAGDARLILRVAAKIDKAFPVETPATTAEPTSAAEPTTEGDKNIVVKSEMSAKDFQAAYRTFAAQLLNRKYEDGQNILISPLSVMVAIAMTENGAQGDTLAQIEKIFGGDVTAWNQALSAYVASLPQTAQSKLLSANAIWLRNNAFAELGKDFLQVNRTCYNATVSEEPFDGATVKKINNWVDDHTDHMINSILDSLDPASVMVLVNALTFDAKWEDEYKTDQISKGLFTQADGENKTVDMMYGKEDKVIDLKNAEGFLKPYAGDGYSFVALLPKGKTTVRELIASLDAATLSDALANAKDERVDTAIPKFESEYSGSLAKTLVDMGMTDAFDDELADFSGMGRLASGNRVAISEVLHKTFITVDEVGTRAGAATAVIMAESSALPARRIYLDRPFVYMIVDNESHLPIFIGALETIEK